MKPKPMSGSYLLILKLSEEQTLTIGRLSTQHFPCGYYAYVGSAMGGFKARISRHLKSNKKLHWHIDYLLAKASISRVVLCETDERIECTLAQILSRYLDSFPGFGCSDCNCRSHLFFSTEESQINRAIMATLDSLSIQPRRVHELPATS